MSSVKVRTPDGVLDVPLRSLAGNTVADLRTYLEKRCKGCVVKLVGQRVTPFEQYDMLGPLLKRAKVKGTTVVFVVDDCGKSAWDVAALETYGLVAVTERETPLVDSTPLRYFVRGQAKYRFEALGPRDVKGNEFEINIQLYNRERLSLIVSQDWTIRRIKSEVQQCLGIPTYNQRLFSKASAGDLLPDYKTVMDCGFGPKSCLDLNLVTGTSRGGCCKRNAAILIITRGVDVRIKVPPRGRTVTLHCDQNDTLSGVKARLGCHIDPARCHSLVPTEHAMDEMTDIDDPQDDEAYLQQCLNNLSLKDLPELHDLEQFDGDGELGLSAQELLAALKASQEQVRMLQREVQVLRHSKQRSRRNSRSSIRSQ